jgi:hypothetical protein
MYLLLLLLFVALTPGILLSFPPKTNKLVVAVVHGVIFITVFHVIYSMSTHNSMYEGFQGAPPAPPPFTGVTINSSDLEPIKGILKDGLTSLRTTILKLIPLFDYIMGTSNAPVSVTLTPDDLKTVKTYYNSIMGPSVKPDAKNATMSSFQKVMQTLNKNGGAAIPYIMTP